MKAKIHPQWFPEAQIICACGNSFVTGAPLPKIEVDVCYNCHPFYTGQMKYVDSAGRVDAFRTKMSMKSQIKVVSKSEKRALKRERKIQKELERPDTLEELRRQTKSQNKKFKV